MSRHKMRKANASLNKGQMVRLVNERVIYVPPILGRCCRFTSAGVLVGCSEVTNEECCCQSDDPNCYTDCDYAEWNQDLNCTDNPCTEDDGACCKNGSCTERTPSECAFLNGSFGGIGSKCDTYANCQDSGSPDECCPTGRCCYGDSCSENIRQSECVGTWTEGASCPSCSETDFVDECCEDRSGACCNEETGECTEAFNTDDCPPGTKANPGETCDTINCEAPDGRCCKECDVDPDCPLQNTGFKRDGGITKQADCDGEWDSNPDRACGGCDPCPDPGGPGRCCEANGLICNDNVLQADCAGFWLEGALCFEVDPSNPSPVAPTTNTCPSIPRPGPPGCNCPCGCTRVNGDLYTNCFGQGFVSEFACCIVATDTCPQGGCQYNPGSAPTWCGIYNPP